MLPGRLKVWMIDFLPRAHLPIHQYNVGVNMIRSHYVSELQARLFSILCEQEFAGGGSWTSIGSPEVGFLVSTNTEEERQIMDKVLSYASLAQKRDM